MLDRVANLLALTVVGGMVATVVASPHTADILKSGGSAWRGVVLASQGK